MTEEQSKKLDEMHEYFFSTPLDGSPSRAAQLDTLLKAVAAGKFSARTILWLAGAVTAIGTAWAALKGWNIR